MADDKGGPSALSILSWPIFLFVILVIAWFYTGGPYKEGEQRPFLRPPAPLDTGETYGSLNGVDVSVDKPTRGSSSGGPSEGVNVSLKGTIQIQKGSAASAIQPPEEYIILKNVSAGPISISGWTLQNAGVNQGGSGILRGSQKTVTIPQGVLVYVPNQGNMLQPIILNKGERAVITTGRIPNTDPYPISSSFKTNMCTGYFDKLPYYEFKPSLPFACPDPEDEPGVEAMDDTCFKFIRGLARCETPQFKYDQVGGGETVNGVRDLSPACKAFLRAHYTYLGCLAYHGRDENFAGKEWRVFLSSLPLWSKDRETISLYDVAGRLVNSLSY